MRTRADQRIAGREAARRGTRRETRPISEMCKQETHPRTPSDPSGNFFAQVSRRKNLLMNPLTKRQTQTICRRSSAWGHGNLSRGREQITLNDLKVRQLAFSMAATSGRISPTELLATGGEADARPHLVAVSPLGAGDQTASCSCWPPWFVFFAGPVIAELAVRILEVRCGMKACFHVIAVQQHRRGDVHP